MDEGLDIGLDFMAVIIAMMICIPFLFSTTMFFLTDQFGGFDSHIIDKTALETSSEIIPTARVIDRDDIMLMLAIADEYALSPVTYNINGYSITVNDAYLADKIPYMINAFAAMDASPKKFTLYYGNSGPRYWLVDNQ